MCSGPAAEAGVQETPWGAPLAASGGTEPFRLSYPQSCWPGSGWHTPRPALGSPPPRGVPRRCPPQLKASVLPSVLGPGLDRPEPSGHFAHPCWPCGSALLSASFHGFALPESSVLLTLEDKVPSFPPVAPTAQHRQGVGSTAGETEAWSVFLRARPPLTCDGIPCGGRKGTGRLPGEPGAHRCPGSLRGIPPSSRRGRSPCQPLLTGPALSLYVMSLSFPASAGTF